MRLIWNDGTGQVDNGAARWAISVAPVLPFPFAGIFYNEDTGAALHLRNGGQAQLSADEVNAVRAYVAGLTQP